MKEIPLSAGYIAVVDDGDYEMASRHKWSALVIKSRMDGSVLNVYAQRRYGPKQTCELLHRAILGLTNIHLVVDHRDHNGLNCQRKNMRIATRKQNSQNLRKHRGSSRFKGVSWHKGARKWIVQIKTGNENRYLGLYTSEEEAGRVYENAAREYHGEFFCVSKI